ncbi:MAG: Fic family protein, partial [candidate division Zixibacteria bacterium]|nr:Fic family protein [candidate division Zixibacteria bacterium]
CAEGALQEPLLYLSLYFKAHRDDYYNHLQNIRENGDWEGWLKFFLRGIHETADQAVHTAKRLVQLFEDDRKKIQPVGKAAGSVLRVHHVLQQSPIISIKAAADKTALTFPTVKTSFDKLEQLGMVSLLPKTRRSKLYSYTQYIGILNQGTEL